MSSFEDRQARLAQTRNFKMAQSSHRYVRGSTIKFYEWLDTSQLTKCGCEDLNNFSGHCPPALCTMCLSGPSRSTYLSSRRLQRFDKLHSTRWRIFREEGGGPLLRQQACAFRSTAVLSLGSIALSNAELYLQNSSGFDITGEASSEHLNSNRAKPLPLVGVSCSLRRASSLR
jgi:hypothetical protein